MIARSRLQSGALLALLAGLASIPALALESDRDQPMDISANDSDSNLNTGIHHLIGNVEIRQGSLLIQAERGEVHQPDERQEVTRVILEGTPARMEQALDNAAGRMRASARRIDYDRSNDTVLLTGGVRIEEPRGTLTGERVTYDMAQGRIQGRGQDGADGRIRFTIPPPNRSSEAGGDTP